MYRFPNLKQKQTKISKEQDQRSDLFSFSNSKIQKFQIPEKKMPGPRNGDFFLGHYMVCRFRKNKKTLVANFVPLKLFVYRTKDRDFSWPIIGIAELDSVRPFSAT